MDTTREHMTIRGKRVLHSTLRRDYVCGECGARLITVFGEVEPYWFTICYNDLTHDPDQFVTSITWETQKAINQAEATDILVHLPADVRAMIEA